MGTVIRLKNVSINESPLGVIKSVFLDSLKVGFTPRTGLDNSLIVSAGTNPSVIGTPTFNSNYLEGDGHTSYVDTGFTRDTSKSFTACIVLRRDEMPLSSTKFQMYFGDYTQRDDVGIGFVSSTSEGIRAALPNTGLMTERPSELKNAPRGEWLYVVMRVDLVKKEILFSCPSVNSQVTESFTGNPMTAILPSDTLTIGGGASENLEAKSKVAFVAFYDRALSDSELDLQQSKAVDYCKSVGVNVML